MKKIILFISIVVFFLSCEGLNQYPQDAISPETFFRTETDLRLFTTPMYDALPGAGMVYETIDNIIRNVSSEEVQGIRIVPDAGGGWDWGGLRRINDYLLRSYQCDNVSVRKRYDGLAKFFRAYFYFDKVKRFGDVPWYNEPIASNNTAALQKPRDSRVLVVDSMLRDINYAIANLPEARTVNEVSKWTALALKSRFCLFEGTFRKYHALPGAEALLQEAADAAYEIITKSGYSIYKETSTPYLNLFAAITPIPSEIILARTFSASLNLYHNVNDYVLMASAWKQGLEKSFVNTYLTIDGKPFTDIPGYNQMEFYDEMQNRDPRLSQTIRTPGYARIGETTLLAPDFGACFTGYHLVKFLATSQYDARDRSLTSMPIFRYGEVLLNYAESKAELGSLTQGDIDLSIKLLRDRVGMPNLNIANANATPDPYMAAQYPNVSGANKGVILEIRRERGVEMVMENFRWDDVMRWKAGAFMVRPFKGMYFPGVGEYDLDQNGTIDFVIWKDTKPNISGNVVFRELDKEIFLSNGTDGLMVVDREFNKKFNEEKDYLYPIPVQERLLNKNLTQNPGWVDGLNY